MRADARMLVARDMAIYRLRRVQPPCDRM